MSPEVLIKEAKDRNIAAMALTDINTSMGIPDFVKMCRQENIHPIAGIEFRNGDKQLFTGIAKNKEGLRELNEFLSQHNISGTPLPLTAPEFNHVFIIYPFEGRPKKKTG